MESYLRSGGRDKLRALLPVHLYGQCAEMDRLQTLADEFGLSVIEDAAQAIGARWGKNPEEGRRAGSMGVSAAFSFYPTKNLSAYGDGGMVTTNDPAMAAHMRACEITAVRGGMSTTSLDGIAVSTLCRQQSCA